ncbi:very short patch repair endonuclease [Paracoccus acridae]|uniref:Very short patch repair endonuclease n=1 Tax=Paracoccus acridae TaxID=1795310 RepID=A0ABQ1VMP2_9RHOB|nr:DNA mismatch endonuclease Vsr [Paracoccus acridae]GGF81910.1 very short patch repair endonuclease [Paracoccus acridae]
MADKLSPSARSENMSKVRSRDTGPELRVRRLLHRAGYRFRLQRRDLPGRPDLYLPKYKLAIFVHGCFWHGHDGCRRARLPTTRPEFWKAKIMRNKERDAAALRALAAAGIEVLTLWACELDDNAILACVAAVRTHSPSRSSRPVRCVSS